MYKMLIVEDDPKIADLLKAHIEKYGDTAIVIHEFDRVLEQFKRHSPTSCCWTSISRALTDITGAARSGRCRPARSFSSRPATAKWIR